MHLKNKNTVDKPATTRTIMSGLFTIAATVTFCVILFGDVQHQMYALRLLAGAGMFALVIGVFSS